MRQSFSEFSIRFHVVISILTNFCCSLKLPKNSDILTKKNVHYYLFSYWLGFLSIFISHRVLYLSDLLLDADKICQNVLITVQSSLQSYPFRVKGGCGFLQVFSCSKLPLSGLWKGLLSNYNYKVISREQAKTWFCQQQGSKTFGGPSAKVQKGMNLNCI